ncbi:hypothetical protein C8R45DRAFT_1219653 [Mycena sanguinolenta]|nr:hypothetical protein C8R45DRAFT_1219653 [Mycena sanguinolenta]
MSGGGGGDSERPTRIPTHPREFASKLTPPHVPSASASASSTPSPPPALAPPRLGRRPPRLDTQRRVWALVPLLKASPSPPRFHAPASRSSCTLLVHALSDTTRLVLAPAPPPPRHNPTSFPHCLFPETPSTSASRRPSLLPSTRRHTTHPLPAHHQRKDGTELELGQSSAPRLWKLESIVRHVVALPCSHSPRTHAPSHHKTHAPPSHHRAPHASHVRPFEGNTLRRRGSGNGGCKKKKNVKEKNTTRPEKLCPASNMLVHQGGAEDGVEHPVSASASLLSHSS